MRSHLKVQGKIVFFIPQYHYFLFSLWVVFVRNKTVLDTAFEMFEKMIFLVRTEQETNCGANFKKLFLSNAPLAEKKEGLLGFLVVYLAWPIWNLLDSKHQQQTSLYEQRHCDVILLNISPKLKALISFSSGQKSWTKSIMAVVQQMSLQFSCLF